MEELFGSCSSTDRQLLAGADVTPFPEPEAEAGAEPSAAGAGLLYHQPTAPLVSPPPPQKLRPIRCSNALRTPTPTLPTEGDGIDGSNSAELGFLPSPQDLGQILLPNGCRPPLEDDDSSAAALFKMKSDMDANFISTIKTQISQLPFSFSSSSDGSGDSAAEKAEKPGPSVKLKRKKRKRLESFLEDLMGQVIQKQEQMHQQLMEMIEKKERERIMREEAWRLQEMEQAQKEQEMRSQEAARNLALLSFIQNALGQDGQMPHPLPAVVAGEDDCENDPNGKRWPTSEVQALITLRTALDHKFQSIGPKAPVWEEISTGMANMGYNRNAKKCKEKWENINKYFKKATGNGKKRSENAKSCPYFHELETLYRNQLITTGKANSPSDEDVEQNGKG